MSDIRRVWIVADVPRDVPGGMRRHMELHAKGLTALGVRTSLICSDSAASTGVTAIDARTPGARLLAGTFRRLKEERPDVINVHTMSAPAFILARKLGLIDAKIVVMSYAADERWLDLMPHDRRSHLRRLRIAIPARLFRFASGIWCVSRQDAAYYAQRYGVERQRIRFIPHAIEDSFFGESNIPRKKNQLLFVGTWMFRKGSDVLKTAFARVLQERPDVSIAIAGTLASDQEILDDLSFAKKGTVRTMSRVNDAELRALYYESTLLVLPSRLEGMPFALLEAMACGCPALTAANSGMLDAVRNGENGWLLNHFDGEAWGNKILDLLAQPLALSVASNIARDSARAFALEGLSRQVLEWYDSIGPNIGST